MTTIAFDSRGRCGKCQAHTKRGKMQTRPLCLYYVNNRTASPALTSTWETECLAKPQLRGFLQRRIPQPGPPESAFRERQVVTSNKASLFSPRRGARVAAAHACARGTLGCRLTRCLARLRGSGRRDKAALDTRSPKPLDSNHVVSET